MVTTTIREPCHSCRSRDGSIRTIRQTQRHTLLLLVFVEDEDRRRLRHVVIIIIFIFALRQYSVDAFPMKIEYPSTEQQ